jgi:AcrR family transcriptional regulator
MAASRRDRHAEDTRTAVLAAARQRFGAAGFADTSLDAVAADADVTIGAVYHHFGGKVQLFDAVFEQIERELVEISSVAIAKCPSPAMVDRLIASMDAYLREVQHPGLQRILFVDAPAVLGTERVDEVFDLYGRSGLRASLQRAEELGKVVVGGHDTASRLIFGALTAAATQPVGDSRKRTAVRRASLDGLRHLMEALVEPGSSEPVVLPPRPA